MKLKYGILLASIAGFTGRGTLNAQKSTSNKENKHDLKVNELFLHPDTKNMFKPTLVLESWAIYSMGEKKKGVDYADRLDISLRRVRFGCSGNPYSWLKYCLQLYLDRLGEDPYAATKGSYCGMDVFDAYITAKLLKNSELINIHAGYFWAAISREFNTSPWGVSSFDKTRAAWYLRCFTTGKGNGVESGVGLGGLKNFGKFSFSYRLGTYEPKAYENSEFQARLYTGRMMFSFGDAEQDTYKYMLAGNQWGTRKGVTLGVGASDQHHGLISDTVFFNNSSAYGADLLIDYNRIRIEGEYFVMNRKATGYSDFNGYEWYIRMGYNVVVGGKYLEPSITYDCYEGKGEKALYKHLGDDRTFDVGLNWYLNKDKLKVTLHYVMQHGTVSTNHGDYWGLGCLFRL